LSKDKYKVKNRSEYNEGLKQRGSLSILIKKEIVERWKYRGEKTLPARKLENHQTEVRVA